MRKAPSPSIGTSLVLALLAFSATSASTQSVATRPDIIVPDCKFDEQPRIVRSLKDAPDIAAEFARQGLRVADVGEPFVPHDVVDSSRDLPHRQFIRAYAFKDRTIVWYHHGGFGTHNHIVELRESRDAQAGPDSSPVLRLTGARLTGNLCVATRALLDGVRGLSDW